MRKVLQADIKIIEDHTGRIRSYSLKDIIPESIVLKRDRENQKIQHKLHKKEKKKNQQNNQHNTHNKPQNNNPMKNSIK